MRHFVFVLFALLSALITLLFAGGTWMAARETLSMTDAPVQATVAEAVERVKSGKSGWVQLTDANADCKQFVPMSSAADGTVRQIGSFVAVNAAKDIEVAVLAHDVASCDFLGRVHYIGVFKALDDADRSNFALKGLALSPTQGPKWALCAWCVSERSWGGAVAALVMTLGAAWFTIILWRKRVPDTPPVPIATRDQSHRTKKKRRSG